MIKSFFDNKFAGKKNFLKTVLYQFEFLFGKYKEYSFLPENAERIVFVCHGNICRSALAAEYFKTKSKFPVASFGLSTQSGLPANEKMAKVSSNLGVDLSKHRTTSVHDFEVRDTDLLLFMQPDHIGRLGEINSRGKHVLLGLLHSRPIVQLTDPYSATETFTNKSAKTIMAATDNLILRLGNEFN